MLPWSVTEKVQRDVAELRAFYASLGIAAETTERALAVMYPALSKHAGAPEKSRRKPPRGRHKVSKAR
jgi:hypothetical protein